MFQYINLTYDRAFKYIFSNELILKDFLNSYFEFIKKDKHVLKVITNVNQAILAANIKNKDYYSDIVVYLSSGEILSLEMYRSFREEQFKKSLSYITRLYSNQLHEGGNYKNAKKVISLNLIKGNYHYNNPDIVNRYGFVNIATFDVLKDDNLEMVIVRLDKLQTCSYNENEKRFIKWLRFINASSIEQMKKIGKDDQIMEETIKYLESFVSDPKIRSIYSNEALEKYQAKEDGIKAGLKVGKKEGKKEGIMSEKRKTAKNMISENFDDDTITKITGLPIKEITKLKVSMN